MLLNIGAVVWLALCFAAYHTSPLRARYLALFSLTTAFAVAANIGFVIFWLLARHKARLLLSLIALGIAWPLVWCAFGWHIFKQNDLTPAPNRLKVMSWNVHGFGIFDRPHDVNTDERILDFIQKEDPDILCLPEFYTIYSNALKPYSTTLLQRCGYREFRFKSDNTLGLKIYLGTAIFSKYPISAFKDIPLDKHVYLLQCDMQLPDGRMVRTYFAHLQSYMLSDGDKTDIEATKHRTRTMPWSKARSYMRRFGAAYARRAPQADSAANIIAQSPYPVILCGDFNDLPGSYTYHRMQGKLADAFAESGRGFGRTFNLFLPTLRIDYIFYDPAALHITGYRSPHTLLSDHNPVIAEFEWK